MLLVPEWYSRNVSSEQQSFIILAAVKVTFKYHLQPVQAVVCHVVYVIGFDPLYNPGGSFDCYCSSQKPFVFSYIQISPNGWLLHESLWNVFFLLKQYYFFLTDFFPYHRKIPAAVDLVKYAVQRHGNSKRHFFFRESFLSEKQSRRKVICTIPESKGIQCKGRFHSKFPVFFTAFFHYQVIITMWN